MSKPLSLIIIILLFYTLFWVVSIYSLGVVLCSSANSILLWSAIRFYTSICLLLTSFIACIVLLCSLKIRALYRWLIGLSVGFVALPAFAIAIIYLGVTHSLHGNKPTLKATLPSPDKKHIAKIYFMENDGPLDGGDFQIEIEDTRTKATQRFMRVYSGSCLMFWELEPVWKDENTISILSAQFPIDKTPPNYYDCQ